MSPRSLGWFAAILVSLVGFTRPGFASTNVGPGLPSTGKDTAPIPASLIDSYGRTTLRMLSDGTLGPLSHAPVATSPDTKAFTARALAEPLFHPYQSYALSLGANAVAIGDVTGDGRADLVAIGPSTYIYVLEQTASGALAPPVSYAAPIGYGSTFSGSVAIADMNGDGRLDVVFTSVNAVGVMMQQADGHLASAVLFPTVHSSFSNTFKAATGDFNHDGRADVVSIDWGTQSHDVDLFLQTSSGLLSSSTVYTVLHGGYDDLDAGDVNGDGWDDVVVLSGQAYVYDTFGVLIQMAQGGFSTVYRDLGGDALARGLGVGDVNGDGRNDVVVSYGGNGPSAGLGVFLQDSGGSLGPPLMLPSYDIPGALVVADVNSDGRKDVLTLHNGWLALGVYLQDATGVLGDETLYSIPYSSWYNAHGLAVGDLNGDSRPDVAIADPNVGVEVLLNAGATTPPVTMTVDVVPRSLNLSSLGRWVTCYLEPPAPFTPSQVDVGSVRLNGTVPVDPSAPTAIGDHDLDGVPDLMVKFNWGAVDLTLSEGDAVPVSVTGQVGDHSFSGTDVIRVHRAAVSAPAAGSVVMAGSLTTVSWETTSDVAVASVAVLCSLDDGASWMLQEGDLPNTGHYEWRAPYVSCQRARVAIVLVESADETGDMVIGVLGMSDTFSIVKTTGVGNPQSITFALHGPRPNPAIGMFRVEFSLSSTEPATLSLHDVSGRRIEVRAVTEFGLGRHIVELGGRSLPAGIYVIRLSQGGRTITGRAALIR